VIKPYYSADGITVYHARFEDVLAAGLVPVSEVALIHADPPYGGGQLAVKAKRSAMGARLDRKRVFAPIPGDDRPFDPAPLLALDRPLVLWGANHYSDKVPGSPSWIFWDKRLDVASDNQADGELAWTNLGGPLRTFRRLWRGFARGADGAIPLHPAQKPEELSGWIFAERAKLKPGALVLVPYLGSGPDLPAARALGLRVIACDVERWCCDTAISRLGAVTEARAAEPVGPLFGGAS